MTDAFNDPGSSLANGADAVTTGRVPIDQDPRFQIPLYLALGIFLGLLIGLVGFNAANSFGPTSTESATIDSIDIDYRSGTGNDATRRTYYVSGETESGTTWKFPSRAAYDLAEREGYPMAATVRFSSITGTAVGLEVADIDETLAGTANRIFFTASTVLAVLCTVLFGWVLRKQGMAALIPFIIGVIPIGSWLGYIAMRAWRGG